MPSFHEVQFPTNVAYGATGGPEFNTTIVSATSGGEQRNINWSIARGQWNVATGIEDATAFAVVLAFFRARFGKAYGFRFKDWFDFQMTNEVQPNPDGSNHIQLQKTYTSGAYSYVRQIFKPVQSVGVHISVAGVAKVEGTHYNVDYTTGIVTWIGTPPAGSYLVTSAEFDVPARFDIDKLDGNYSSFSTVEVQTIPIVELKKWDA